MRGKLAVDAVALIAYVVVSLPALTGVAFHEWLGLAVFVVLGVHLAQHLIQALPRRKASPARDAAAPARGAGARTARSVLAVLLAVALVTCVVSGVMVSGAVLPALGLYAEGYYFWNPLHAASAKVLLALLLIHLFLNAGIAYRLLRRKSPSVKKETDHDRDR